MTTIAECDRLAGRLPAHWGNLETRRRIAGAANLIATRSLSIQKEGTAMTADKPHGRQVEILEPEPGMEYNEARFAAQYEASTALQKEFGDKAAYLAFCRHMCRGGVKLARR